MITIIDCGSQLTQNIARRVRELGVESEIVPYHAGLSDVVKPGLEGLIISGGQFSVYDEGAPMYDKEFLAVGVPVLGICYGMQSIAHLCGGKVSASPKREYGSTKVRIVRESPLFDMVAETEFDVWMSHGDIVGEMPPCSEVLMRSANGHVAALNLGGIYAVQFHPEVDHTKYGRVMLSNFLDICGAKRTYDPDKRFDSIVEETAQKVKGKVGIGGISGGVDSTAASVLIHQVIGGDYHPFFVDNGLLRLGEAGEVRSSLERFIPDFCYVDASKDFLERLSGVSNPDAKRKIIGNYFIEVFEAEARNVDGASFLVQGTLYPDVIESVPIYGASSKIKRHHNVGGLPERLGLDIVEPFRGLFKDEVRKIASERLGLPDSVVWRHPFPGPGLAVRIIGEVTDKKLAILRQADHIFIEELKMRGLYRKVSQAFAVLNDSRSVGVMGDGGNYEGIVALRAVTTDDFMTSDVFRFDWDDIQGISNRIINEVKGVNRVVYDMTQKPPGTIEWE
jgi:GMP synthase (glutamine-hydrolysing)